MTAVRQLFVQFNAKFNGQQLKKGEKQLQALKASAMRLAAVLGAGMLIKSVASMTAEMSKLTLEMERQAERFGFASKAYQEWAFGVGQLGIRTEEFTMSLEHMEKQIGLAQAGSKAILPTLKAMGIKLKDLEGMSTAEQFEKVGLAMGSLGTANEQGAASFKLFGKMGNRLLPILRRGEEGIASVQDRFGKMHLLIDNKVSKSMQQIAIDTDVLSQAWKRVKTGAASSLQPTVEKLLGLWEKYGSDILYAVEQSGAFERIIKLLAVSAGILSVAFGGPLAAIVLGVTAAVVVVDDLTAAWMGGESQIGSLYKEITGTDISEVFAGIHGTVAMLGSALLTLGKIALIPFQNMAYGAGLVLEGLGGLLEVFSKVARTMGMDTIASGFDLASGAAKGLASGAGEFAGHEWEFENPMDAFNAESNRYKDSIVTERAKMTKKEFDAWKAAQQTEEGSKRKGPSTVINNNDVKVQGVDGSPNTIGRRVAEELGRQSAIAARRYGKA